MSNFSALKTAIQNAIKQNGNQEITGNVLQNILISMVETMGDSAIIDLETAVTGIKNNIDNGYVYAGIATPSTTPVSGKVFYIATQAGTYTNFGNIAVTQGINILKNNGSVWSKDLEIGIDDEPTAGSDNLVKSGNINNYAEEVNGNSNDFIGWKFEEVSNVNRDAATDRAYSNEYLNFELGFKPEAGGNYKIEITTANAPADGSLSFTLANSIVGYTGIIASQFKIYNTQGDLQNGRTVFVHIPDNISANYITASIRVSTGNINIKTYKCLESSLENKISDEINGVYKDVMKLSNIHIGGTVSSVDYPIKKGYEYEFICNSADGSLNFYYFATPNEKVMFGKLNHTIGLDSFKYNSEFDFDKIYFTNYSGQTSFSINVIRREKRKLNVILDTDFGGDCDDLFAVSHLLLAQKAGKINVLGINASIQRSGTIEGIGAYTVPTALSCLCNYFGYPFTKLGIDKSESSGRESHYCATLCLYPHPSIPDYEHPLDYVDDTVVFYRKLLASLPDGETCNVALVGAPMGFSRFLNSPADTISTKTGLQLALEKIDTLWWMAGKYPTGIETNMALYSVSDSQNILTKFTNKIIFVGWEWNDVHCGDILYDDNMNYSILYKAMNEFMVDAFNNGENPWGYQTLEETWHGKSYAWDPLTVMAMCINNISFNGYMNYILSDIGITLKRGTVTLANDGTDTFTEDTTGHHYVSYKTSQHSASWYTHRLDIIIRDRLFK